MAKAKAQKGSSGVAQSHLRARMSFLYNAAVFLQSAAAENATAAESTSSPTLHTSAQASTTSPRTSLPGVSHISRQYAAQLRAVSHKTQLRLSQSDKRSLCKRCETLLVPGASCSEEIENKSRGGKKPWAAVRVVKCWTCGTAKRFPQSRKRSMRLVERKQIDKENLALDKEASGT